VVYLLDRWFEGCDQRFESSFVESNHFNMYLASRQSKSHGSGKAKDIRRASRIGTGLGKVQKARRSQQDKVQCWD
jgi:hypothetical protein